MRKTAHYIVRMLEACKDMHLYDVESWLEDSTEQIEQIELCGMMNSPVVTRYKYDDGSAIVLTRGVHDGDLTSFELSVG